MSIPASLASPCQLGVAQRLPIVKPMARLGGRDIEPVGVSPQAIATALRCAFHIRSKIAARFTRFQAMPFKKAAA